MNTEYSKYTYSIVFISLYNFNVNKKPESKTSSVTFVLKAFIVSDISFNIKSLRNKMDILLIMSYNSLNTLSANIPTIRHIYYTPSNWIISRLYYSSL